MQDKNPLASIRYKSNLEGFPLDFRLASNTILRLNPELLNATDMINMEKTKKMTGVAKFAIIFGNGVICRTAGKTVKNTPANAMGRTSVTQMTTVAIIMRME